MALMALFPADVASAPLAAGSLVAVAWVALVAAEVGAAVWARAVGFGWLAAGHVALCGRPVLVRLFLDAAQRDGGVRTTLFVLHAGATALAYVVMIVGVVLLARRIRELAVLVDLMAAEPVTEPGRPTPGSSCG
jgi:hypothetical protein